MVSRMGLEILRALLTNLILVQSGMGLKLVYCHLAVLDVWAMEFAFFRCGRYWISNSK